MAKITLTINEVNQIIVDYLASKGQLETGPATVTWNVEMFIPVVSGVTIEQDELEIEPGKSYTFETTSVLDSKLKKYNGTTVKVLRRLSKDECDETDVGPMFKVRFEDGYERDVFEDELIGEA